MKDEDIKLIKLIVKALGEEKYRKKIQDKIDAKWKYFDEHNIKHKDFPNGKHTIDEYIEDLAKRIINIIDETE